MTHPLDGLRRYLDSLPDYSPEEVAEFRRQVQQRREEHQAKAELDSNVDPPTAEDGSPP